MDANDSGLPLLDHWSQFSEYLLATTLKFPKRVRFTFASRIDNLALDILEGIIEARYRPRQQKRDLLLRINLYLEKLRLLLRMCYRQKYLASGALEHCCRQIDNCGRQVGGWLKSVS